MRAFPILAIIFLAVLAASDAATAAPSLDGWGPFKFGMTPLEAHAIPDVPWREPAKRRPGDRPAPNPATTPFLMSRPMTSEYGPQTDVMLSFNHEHKLMMIHLSFSDAESATDCEKTFQKLLTRLDTKYGPFTPGGQKDQWIFLDMAIRGGMLERTTEHSLPGSRSRYWHRTVLPNISGLNLEAEAKHTAGSRSVEVMMYQKDGKDGGCVRNIAFTDFMPTKAELERQAKLKHVPAGMDWHWAAVDHPAGMTSGPTRGIFSAGPAEHVKLGGGRFAADVVRPPGSPRSGTVHLVGTISADNKISAHPSGAVSGDFPTSFEGWIQTFATDGEPVDVYEIHLTGKTPSDTADLWMAAYYRNSPHTPSPEACQRIAETDFALRGRSPRERTYRGFLQALGCPPP